MTYWLKQFDKKCLEETTAKWTGVAAELDIPFHEYEKQLTWVGGHIDYTIYGDSYAYGVFADESKVASAIADIVYSKRAGPDIGSLKLLELTMGPEHAQSQVNTADKLLEVVRIYVSGILGTIALTDVHKARVIKMYGHNDQLKQVLVAVHLHFQSEIEQGKAIAFTSRIEGHWLVIAVN